jgi:hypothetical protein
LAGLLVTLAAGFASAEERATATLAYDVDAAASASCPGAAEFRKTVADRLGHDPFVEAGDVAVNVRIAGTAGQFAATLELSSSERVVGKRELGPTRRCDVLVRAVVLTLAIFVDTYGADPAGLPPEPEPAGTPTQSEPAQADSPPAEVVVDPPSPTAPAAVGVTLPVEPGTPIAAHVGVSAAAAFGILPAPGPGFGLGVELRRGPLALTLDLHRDSTAATAEAGGEIRASMWSGTAGGCLSRGGFAGCGLVAAGLMDAEGAGYVMTDRVTSPYLAAGARLAWELPLTRRFAAQVNAETLATLVRTELKVIGMPAGGWTAPPGSVRLGFVLLARFW